MKLTLKIILITAGAAALALLCLSFGSTFIAPREVLAALLGKAAGTDGDVVLYLRLPRMLLALITGASLAASGSLFQALLRNPLSEPYTVGVSGGAAFGAALAIALGGGTGGIMLAAFAGSVGTVAGVHLISRRVRMGSPSLILAGIALSFILSSGVLLVFALIRAEQVHKALMWLMGDLSVARYGALRRSGPFALILIGVSMAYYRHLNVISFGEQFARNLGVRRMDVYTIYWIAALLAAQSVALAGVIGFVGLIVPHAVRAWTGPDHRLLIPLSALSGGVFLMVCDTIGRSIAPPYEVPAGIITGFAGGIFFLFLMLSGRGSRI